MTTQLKEPEMSEERNSSRDHAPDISAPSKGRVTTAFTPGPWGVEFGDHSHSYVRVTGDDERTVHYLYITSRGERERAEANGHLIAAAPEMYEALSAILDGVEDQSEPGDDMDAPVMLPLTLREIAVARAALAKADGEPRNEAPQVERPAPGRSRNEK
jgi:hypothetical protein